MIDDDADQARVEQLLEQILESGNTPEEVCRPFPELLPEVRAGLRQLRRLEEEVGALFPPSSPGDTELTGLLDTAELPVVPGYEVLAVLGHGGMGIVFRARHLRLNRPVALKMILAGEYALPSQRQRFLREAEAVASIDHPNIVQVHDAGESEARAWFTMELVEGGSLAHRINGAPQPVGLSAALMANIAQGVAVAHQHGIVHRDLKPSNILLTADGTPKVADFGLARWSDGPETTLTGCPLGTASYMAPEQARGASHEVGPAADVFSLGAILYEMLTGRPPFRGETSAATIQQVLTDSVVPPRRLNLRVPRDLETICLKCLDKHPARRYPTARELAEDLSRFLNYEPIRARRVGRIERCLRWGRRRPAHAALLIGGIFVAVALIIGGLELRAQRQAKVRGVQTDLLDAQRLARSSAWAEATAAIDRAQARLGSAGPQDLRQRLNEERSAIERARRRLELVQRVQRVRLTRLTWVEGRFNPQADRLFRNEKADQEYASAFTTAGLGAVGDDAVAVASRIGAFDAVPEAVVALDDWRLCAADRRRRDWLADVLRRLDRDPWRNRVRDPAVWESDSALRSIAQSTSVAEQQVDFLITLAERIGQVAKDGIEYMKAVQQSRASDFWANFELGNMLLPDDPQQAAAYYSRATALRPDSVAALNNLGVAQYASFWFTDATNSFHQALRLQVTAATLNNLGRSWKVGGNWPEAEAYFRDAIRADPDLAEARCNLAEITSMSGGEGVVEQLRRALAVDPKFARAHYLLGMALCARAPIDEARAILVTRNSDPWGAMVEEPIAYYHAAISFDPTWVPVTQDRARLGEAIAEFRAALTHDPSLARASGALGQALLNQGKFEAALEATRRAIELSAQPHPHEDGLSNEERDGVAGQLERCQHALDLDARLPSIRDGSTAPADAEEALELAEICVAKGRNGAAAMLYLRAFEASPAFAAGQKAGNQYRAACAAALAEADALDDPGPGWRRQSREWLRAELEQYAARLESANRADAVRIYFQLSHWLTDPALSSIRDEAPLVGISRQEADECTRLWADVRALRDRAEKVVDQGTVAPG